MKRAIKWYKICREDLLKITFLSGPTSGGIRQCSDGEIERPHDCLHATGSELP